MEKKRVGTAHGDCWFGERHKGPLSEVSDSTSSCWWHLCRLARDALSWAWQHLSIYVSESLIFLWFIIVLAWLLMAFVVAWQGMLWAELDLKNIVIGCDPSLDWQISLLVTDQHSIMSPKAWYLDEFTTVFLCLLRSKICCIKQITEKWACLGRNGCGNWF